MKFRRLFFLIHIVIILLLFGIYLLQMVNTPHSQIQYPQTIVTTETTVTNDATVTMTVNSSVLALQYFEICPSNCGYPSPYISGLIVFNQTHAAIKTLRFFVDGVGGNVGSFPIGLLDNFSIGYRGYVGIKILPVHQYNLLVITTFWDNTTYTASEIVTSDQTP
jgi:hypothetical protein